MGDEAPPSAVDDAAVSTPSEPSSAPPSPAPSSPSETSDTPGQSKESLLDAVLKVVPATTEKDVLDGHPKDDAAPPDAAQLSSEDQAEAETEDGPDDDEPPPPETAPAVRKKINKLLKQRRELRDELSALQGPAQIGAELQNYAQANGLSGDDIAGTLRVAALLKAGDYRTFYETIAPYVRTAQEYLGLVLPRDVADLVKKGQMTEEAGRVFTRQKYDAERARYEQSATETAYNQQAVQYVQNDVKRAVSNFELRLSASDPDYKAKQPAVRRAAQALLFERGGQISSVDEALAITRDAYEEVNRQVRAYQPRPNATLPKPNGASQSPSARPAPKSLMEAAMQGLENYRRGAGG